MECGCGIGMVSEVRCIVGVGGNGMIRKNMINQLSSLCGCLTYVESSEKQVGYRKIPHSKTLTQISLTDVHFSKARRGRVTLVDRPGALNANTLPRRLRVLRVNRQLFRLGPIHHMFRGEIFKHKV